MFYRMRTPLLNQVFSLSPNGIHSFTIASILWIPLIISIFKIKLRISIAKRTLSSTFTKPCAMQFLPPCSNVLQGPFFGYKSCFDPTRRRSGRNDEAIRGGVCGIQTIAESVGHTCPIYETRFSPAWTWQDVPAGGKRRSVFLITAVVYERLF